MPKLKVKPTPAQARILRALDQNPGLYIGWSENSRRGWWSGVNCSLMKRELGEPRESTIRKLIAEEWIEPAEDTDLYHTVTASGSEWVAQLQDEDFIPKPKTMTAYEVKQAIRLRFNAPDWFLVEELSHGAWGLRRIDVFALRIHAGSARDMTSYLTTIAMEIKVDRRDFLNELKDPQKRETFMEIASRFIFVAPAGLIKPEEIPEGCGLLEVHSKKRTRMKVRPPFSKPSPPSWRLVAAMARSMLKENEATHTQGD